MNIKIILFVALTYSLFFTSVAAQDKTLFEKHFLVQGGDTLPYRVLLPINYDSTKKYPVIFFLHGAGERGNDNERQLVHGSKLFLQDSNRAKYPSIVVFPQCSKNSYWSNTLRLHGNNSKREFFFIKNGEPTQAMNLLINLVNYIVESYPVNSKRVYVGGLSMGGMGTFELVRRMPNMFAAAFPICGGANAATASAMKNVKWWIFHGGKDDIVLPIHSKKMVDALKKNGADVKFTYYPNANHNSWDAAFTEPKLLSWVFSNQKK